MKLIPNPEFQEAEYELSYFNRHGTKMDLSIPVRRWRLRDHDEVVKALIENDESTLRRLEVPSHIVQSE